MESTLSIVNDTSITVVVKSLLAYLEAFYEYHETCLGFDFILITLIVIIAVKITIQCIIP